MSRTFMFMCGWVSGMITTSLICALLIHHYERVMHAHQESHPIIQHANPASRGLLVDQYLNTGACPIEGDCWAIGPSVPQLRMSFEAPHTTVVVPKEPTRPYDTL